MSRQRDDEDRRAILAAIDDMTSAYFAKDFNRWAELWVHAPYTTRWYWFRNGGITIREGWETQAALMREAMTRQPARNPSAAAVRRENVTILIDGDLAWVNFDQIAPRTGDAFDVPGLQKEMRVMQRQDGVWRVAFHGAIQRTTDDGTSPLVGVDGRGRLLWISRLAAAALEQAEGLEVRAGRLRARDRVADQRLQAAIRWAASLEDGLERAGTALPFVGQRGALPVVIGGGSGVAAEVCWVMGEGGQVTVSVNDKIRADRLLEAAALLYGLSTAQLRLARAIVEGFSIVVAAGALGISVNTARTHLQRIYDKTGVRSQPALVRALMSVVSPLL